MERMWLALAFIALAGTVSAQTLHTSTQAPGGALADGEAGASDGQEVASAPIPLSAGATIARDQIERDGYRDVRGLARGTDGLWQGTALRGNTSVQVTVDRAGNVAAK